MSDPPRLVDSSWDSLAQAALLAAQTEANPSEACVAQTLRMLHTASCGSSARARRRSLLRDPQVDGDETTDGPVVLAPRAAPRRHRVAVDSHALWIGIAGLLLTFAVVMRWAWAVGCSPG